MISKPVKNDIQIWKDRDFRITLYLKDADGAVMNTIGWSFKAQIRPKKGSNTLVAEFDVSHSYVYGTVVLSLSDDTTRNLNVENPVNLGSTTTTSTCQWDFVATNNADYRYSLMEGVAYINETVTRED
jgi:hypothetical protein